MGKDQDNRYVLFLRGINVGGHHKVPMADLRDLLQNAGLQHVSTLLNSGNVIFSADTYTEKKLNRLLLDLLKTNFPFPVPFILIPASEFKNIVGSASFNATSDSDTGYYLTFLPEKPKSRVDLSTLTAGDSFKIVEINGRFVFSTLDKAASNTVNGMEVLEKLFGKDITTRNWNTVQKIRVRLEAG